MRSAACFPFPAHHVIFQEVVRKHTEDAGSLRVPLGDQVVKTLGVLDHAGIPCAAQPARYEFLAAPGFGPGLCQKLLQTLFAEVFQFFQG